jgi:nicotinamide-nucleotide amidase
MFNQEILSLANQIIRRYAREKKRIATAESCTGGMIAATLTRIPGSSQVFERGFITYSNDAKIDVLGVLPDVLELHGAVSAEVAEAMAQGALEYSRADVAVSVTGIAGPDGGTPGKPVGLVFLGLATKDGALFHMRCEFKGNRDAIRLEASHEAMKLLLSAIEKD